MHRAARLREGILDSFLATPTDRRPTSAPGVVAHRAALDLENERPIPGMRQDKIRLALAWLAISAGREPRNSVEGDQVAVGIVAQPFKKPALSRTHRLLQRRIRDHPRHVCNASR